MVAMKGNVAEISKKRKSRLVNPRNRRRTRRRERSISMTNLCVMSLSVTLMTITTSMSMVIMKRSRNSTLADVITTLVMKMTIIMVTSMMPRQTVSAANLSPSP